MVVFLFFVLQYCEKCSNITVKAVKNMLLTTEKLGSVVKYHRKRSGLSQLELADLAGIGKTVVFDMEKGKETVKLNTILKVLKVLNISLRLESPFIKEFLEKNNAES